MGSHSLPANKPSCPPDPRCPWLPLREVCWGGSSVCSLRGRDLGACPSRCQPARRRHSVSDKSWEIVYNRKCFHFCFISSLLEWEKYTGLKDQFVLYLLLLQGQKVLINHKAIICSDLISCKLQEMGFFFSTLWGWNS